MVGGLIAFFNYGGKADSGLSSSQKKILETGDERLSLGEKDAPVRIVEYVDVMCQYCAQANREVVPKIKSDFIDKGKVHYEVRLVGVIDEDSKRAAEGAYCAAEQGMFWNYLDTAYDDTWNDFYNQGKKAIDIPLFSSVKIADFAESTGVDRLVWQRCMDKGEYGDTVDINQSEMSSMGAYGTPHFLINEHGYNGAPPYQSFKAVINSELKKADA